MKIRNYVVVAFIILSALSCDLTDVNADASDKDALTATLEVCPDVDIVWTVGSKVKLSSSDFASKQTAFALFL